MHNSYINIVTYLFNIYTTLFSIHNIIIEQNTGSNEFTSTAMKSTTAHILPSTTEITTKRSTTTTTTRTPQSNDICSNSTLDAITIVDNKYIHAFKG